MSASNDDPRDASLTSRSERVFADFLAHKPEPAQEDLEHLAAEHRELGAELRELYRDWREFRSTPGMLVSRVLAASSPSRSETFGGGERVAHFQCVRVIGRGGMGEVWEADDLELKRRVALKLLPLGAEASSVEFARFRREAEAAGKIRHDGIVAVHSAGASDGRAYIAYELVPGGRTLRHWLDELARTTELAADHDLHVARLFVELCDALEAAHRSGAIHRDLKPQNVLLTPEGRPKVADFGLAKLAGADALSQSGSFVGTWPYASPEQVSSDGRPLDARSDVFSLGVTLYECLALRRPFSGDTIEQIARQILEFDPPDPRALRSRCPRDLALICSKAIEKRREQRYASMQEFGDDLRHFLAHEPIDAREPSSFERAVKWTRRHPTSSIAIALSSIGCVVALALFMSAEHARGETLIANQALKSATADAITNSQRAVAEADRAREQAALSEQVTNFLVDMFDDADPKNGSGEAVTANHVLDRALERIRSDRDIELHTRARLEAQLARVFVSVGRRADSTELLFEACDLWGGPDGDLSPEAEDARLSLGLELGFTHANEASFQLLDAVHARSLASGEADCSRAADDWTARAEVLHRMGRFAESETSCLRAIELSNLAPERDDARIAAARIRLATEYLAENRLAEAELEARLGIELDLKTLGAANLPTLVAQCLLAAVQKSERRFADAEATFKDCLPKFEKALGPESVVVLTARSNLAVVLGESGKLDEATELLRDTIQVRRRKAREEDEILVNLETQLAACLILQREFDEAVPLLRRSVAFRSKMLGDQHPRTLEACTWLAQALCASGVYAEALELQSRTVEFTAPDAPELGPRRALLEQIQDAAAAVEKR